MASVLGRDGQQRSATQTHNQALADADHLALLHAIWTAETTRARDQRYRDLLMNVLPPGYRREPGHQARWLWRTLRAAELAGLEPAGVLADAIAERDLAGSRDIAAVIDARLRHRLGSLVPLPSRPWSAQVPAIADPERHAYVAEIAALMDARKDRIGEHAVGHPAACAQARAAVQRGDHGHAAAKKALAAGYQALEQAYRQRETVFTQTMADRADWDAATRAQRQLAVAADAELHRRHPGQYFPPLRSAEPEPTTAAQRDGLTPTPDQPPSETDQWIKDLAAGHRTFAGRLADRHSQMIPSEDADYGDLGPAFPAGTGLGRKPI